MAGDSKSADKETAQHKGHHAHHARMKSDKLLQVAIEGYASILDLLASAQIVLMLSITAATWRR